MDIVLICDRTGSDDRDAGTIAFEHRRCRIIT
jgi:hypothetical protein